MRFLAFEHGDRWKYTAEEYDQWLRGRNPHGLKVRAPKVGKAWEEVMKLIPDVIDFGTAEEFHLAASPAFHRISQNTICVELYASKIVDGKVQMVLVLRNTWDRSCWLAAQEALARIFGDVATLPEASDREDEVCVH
jgi:hypothetical protein